MSRAGLVGQRDGLLAGDAAETIVEQAAQRHVDLIVMATHSWSGLRRWALGSVADKVLHATMTLLLLVRARPSVLKLARRQLQQYLRSDYS